MADVPTKVPVNNEHVPLEPSEEWKRWSTACQAVRNIWLIVGPKLRVRPEQWPRVRLPAPEPEPEMVETERPRKLSFRLRPLSQVLISVLLSMKLMPSVSTVRDTLAFILAVVVSTTTPSKVDRVPLKRKKRAKLPPDFQGDDLVYSAQSAGSGGCLLWVVPMTIVV
eukprot:4810704-Amphidinium_carterae.1